MSSEPSMPGLGDPTWLPFWDIEVLMGAQVRNMTKNSARKAFLDECES